MKMYKLVATDLDGTLVTDDKKLMEQTIQTIQKAVEKNIKIVLSSARSFYRLESYIDKLDLRKKGQYTICFNGAMIVENFSQKVQNAKHLEKEEILEIISLGKNLQIPMMLYAKEQNYVEEIPDILLKNKNAKGIRYQIGSFEKIDFNQEENYIYRIAFIDTFERINDIRKKIPLEFFQKYEITSSSSQYIEFVKKGIKKSEAIKFIIEQCHIKQSEVIAIGDSENDIEMLKFAGLGVAVENANFDVKENANFITTSNNQNGVGKVIETFILQED